jgi:acetyl esterase
MASIDPTLQPFLSTWRDHWSTCPPDAPLAQRRAHFERLAAAMAAPFPPEVDAAESHPVPSPRGTTRVRVFRHRMARQPAPAVVFAHGGGFRQGSADTHAEMAAALCARTGATVFSVDYALSPEHVYPMALQEMQAVLTWIHAQAHSLCVDATRVAAAGDSAGGNLAAALAQQVRATPCALTAQLLLYPWLDFATHRPSHTEHGTSPMLTTAALRADALQYCPDEQERERAPAAPLRVGECTGLPASYLIAAECDPLRDEAQAYAERLQAAGVDTTLDVVAGMTHSFLRALSSCPAADQSLARATHWLALRLDTPLAPTR